MIEKERRLKIVLGINIFLIAAVIYASIYSGTNIDRIYYYGLVAGLLLAIPAVYVYGTISSIRAGIKIKEEWGKTRERKRNLNEIEELFKRKEINGSFSVDDQTWEDLNMDKIYALLDRTYSTPGEQELYCMLRTPLMNGEEFERRERIISFFQNNREARENIQLWLHKLGRQKNSLITSFLWGRIPSTSRFKNFFNIMGLAALLSVISIRFFSLEIFLLSVGAVFVINLLIHYRVKNIISNQLSSITYIRSLVKCAYNISTIKESELGYYTDPLKKSVNSCSRILKKIRVVGVEAFGDIAVIYEYINIFFLIEVRAFFGALDDIAVNIEEIKKIFSTVGEIDALISAASYRDGLREYSVPNLHHKGACVEIINAAHPLLENPVANSLAAKNEGIIITGSNMSGKSTFLRTIGVNVLFAQTICTCTSESYSGSYFKILTSISQGDNLIGGKSYYLAEAESLLRIINASGDDIPSLCIIDEIFRGTNPVERTGASAEILGYLVKHNTITIVATHDLEITEMLKDSCSFYYFSEDIGETGLDFDYKIKEGVSKNRNAVKLMKYLGYPEEIINKTTNRVSELLKEC